MAKWMKYTGSEAQLKELLEVKDGYLVACKWDSGEATTSRIVSMPFSIFIKTPVGQYVTHYLICKPHPLARMKEQHGQTGQPVWAANKETVRTTADHWPFWPNSPLLELTTPEQDTNMPGDQPTNKL